MGAVLTSLPCMAMLPIQDCHLGMSSAMSWLVAKYPFSALALRNNNKYYVMILEILVVNDDAKIHIKFSFNDDKSLHFKAWLSNG